MMMVLGTVVLALAVDLAAAVRGDPATKRTPKPAGTPTATTKILQDATSERRRASRRSRAQAAPAEQAT